jgi:hypothetical protein
LQLPVAATALEEVSEVAVVGRSFEAPFLNVVDVPVMFQPARAPDSSSAVRTRELLAVWSAPFSVTDQEIVEGAVRARLAPPQASKRSIVPAAPLAQPSIVVGKLEPVRFCVVFEVSAAQLVPPFVDLITFPDAPVAKQTVVETQLTLRRSFEVPDVCAVQVEPPSALVITVPAAPTATHTVELGHETP